MSGRDGRSDQPQHPLKPEPDPEQGSNSPHFLGRLREVKKPQKESLKLVEVDSRGLRKEAVSMTRDYKGKQQVLLWKLPQVLQEIWLRIHEGGCTTRQISVQMKDLLLEEDAIQDFPS